MTPLRFIAAALQRMVDRIDPQAGRYRMLFESSPLPMWVLDAESLRFISVNHAAVRLYGYSREEFLAMTAREIDPESGDLGPVVARHTKKNGEVISTSTGALINTTCSNRS